MRLGSDQSGCLSELWVRHNHIGLGEGSAHNTATKITKMSNKKRTYVLVQSTTAYLYIIHIYTLDTSTGTPIHQLIHAVKWGTNVISVTLTVV